MYCSPFRDQGSARLPVKLENTLLSVDSSLNICADLLKASKQSFAFRKVSVYPQFSCS